MEDNLPQQVNTIPVPTPISNSQSVSEKSSSTMWDAFEHILMFISLYVMATAIVLVLNFFIDKWFPGVSDQSYSRVYSTANDFRLVLLRGYFFFLFKYNKKNSAKTCFKKYKKQKNTNLFNASDYIYHYTYKCYYIGI